MKATNFLVSDTISLNIHSASGSVQRAIVEHFKRVASTKGDEIFSEPFTVNCVCDMSIIMRNTRLFVVEVVDMEKQVAYHFDCSYNNGMAWGSRNACGMKRSLA